jgi:predicted aldo/keto reductase-like oxidoreductase
MNPLGGGIIPQHPELFNFIRREGEGVTAAALRFLWDHAEITNTLVGFGTMEHLNEALNAMEGYTPRTQGELDEVKSKASASFEGICTGCAYCDNCPQGIPIPKYMDAYNQKLLDKDSDDPIGNRLKWHWNLEMSAAGKCTACADTFKRG